MPRRMEISMECERVLKNYTIIVLLKIKLTDAYCLIAYLLDKKCCDVYEPLTRFALVLKK